MGCRNTQRYLVDKEDYKKPSPDNINTTEPWKTYDQNTLDKETKIQAEYFQDFFQRLNQIKKFHLAYDKGVYQRNKLIEDYTIYAKDTEKDKKISKDLLQWKDINTDNIYAAIDNLVNYIPYLKSAVKNGQKRKTYELNPSDYHDLSALKAGPIEDAPYENLHVDKDLFINNEQYNIISENINYLEKVCAHNSDKSNNGNCGDNNDSAPSGGSSGNSNCSPVFGGDSSTDGCANPAACINCGGDSSGPCSYNGSSGTTPVHHGNTTFSVKYDYA